MHYLFMPLDQHFDKGFGATGQAFKLAGDLVLQGPPSQVINVQLPACFLYRHAIELFLKSMIVTLHRGLKIPYGENDSDGPASVLSNGAWKPIHQVHSVAL